VAHEAVPRRGLAGYVPSIAAEWAEVRGAERWQVVDGTLCLVDISGSTALFERLAAQGRVAAEELTDLLSDVFSRMIDRVQERGGTQLKFGGDALLSLFTGRDHAMQAASAAVEMRRELRNAVRGTTALGRLPLRMSAAVESGAIHLFLAGDAHHELVVAGPVASATTALERAAEAGEIVVGPVALAALPRHAAERPRGPGHVLRWRSPPISPPEPRAQSTVDARDLERHVPVGLRQVLSSGPDPEHRTATIAFVRFSGIDRLIAEAGPPATAEVIDALVTVVQQAAEREGVTILATDVDTDGGKVILVTGAPATNVDDEGRMLRCLRTVVDAPSALSLRAGVNRGHVFAGEVGRGERWRTYTVMGDAVNLAARLGAAAPPSTVYATRPVVEGSLTAFAVTRTPPLTLKGLSAPVTAYVLGDEIGQRDRSVSAEMPFTGRGPELARLSAMIDGLGGGHGGAVTVTGAAGVGKSRLVHEALTRARAEHLVLRAEPYRVATPYRPWRDAMRGVLGIERTDGRAMARELRARVADLDPTVLPMLPLVGAVTHISVPSTEEVDAIAGPFRPARTAEVVETLLAAAYDGPLVLVVEDAHGVDEATSLLLDQLVVNATPRHPWLVVSVRRLDAGGFMPATGERVTLHPLLVGESRRLAELATSAAPLRPHDIERVVARAGGNPLFLEEVLRVARDTGTIDMLPHSLEAVIGVQIDALSPLARRLLRCAAVLGGSFRADIFEQIVAAEGLSADAATREALTEFFEPSSRDRLRFRHAVVRDVAYEGLPYGRRRELHRSAAQILTRAAGASPETVADLLALHYARARDHALAWHYGVIAGDRAREAFANPEAAANYVLALDAARRVADIPGDDRAGVLTHLGDVREQDGEFADALEAYRQATSLRRHDPLGRARLALRRARARERMGSYAVALRETTAGLSALDDGSGPADGEEAAKLRAQLVVFSAVVRQAQERPRAARTLAARGVEMARAAGDQQALARGYMVLDWAQRASGEPHRESYGEMALALYEEIGDTTGVAGSTSNLGMERYFEGRWHEAAELYERARTAFLRIGNAVQAAICGANMGELLVSQGRLDEAEPVLRDAGRVLRASAFVDGATFAEQQLGRLLARRGETDAAIELLGAVHAELDAIGQTMSAFEAALHLADALTDRGEPHRALELRDAAAARAGPDAAHLDAHDALVRGRALAALGRVDEAAGVVAGGVSAAEDKALAYELELLLRLSSDVDDQRMARGSPIPKNASVT
jgi:class 3 adenylate cyclase/tetratricopeptide (TPR) repeat protein